MWWQLRRLSIRAPDRWQKEPSMQMLDIINAFDSSHKTCQVLNVELLVLLQASERKRRAGSTSLPT
jgi:hypothetical protein